MNCPKKKLDTNKNILSKIRKIKIKFLLGESTDGWIPVDVSFIKEFWLPDAEILNLKEFKTLDVLSKVDQIFL